MGGATPPACGPPPTGRSNLTCRVTRPRAGVHTGGETHVERGVEHKGRQRESPVQGQGSGKDRPRGGDIAHDIGNRIGTVGGLTGGTGHGNPIDGDTGGVSGVGYPGEEVGC